jgi:hypothetical protein
MIDEISTAEAGYTRIRERRIEVGELKQALAALRSSNRARSVSFAATNEKAAVLILQSHMRTAIEQAQGKLISSIQSNVSQVPDTVAVLLRARVPQSNFAAFLSAVEYGSPPIRFEELTMSSRGSKPGDAKEIEWTATVRARWMIGDK